MENRRSFRLGPKHVLQVGKVRLMKRFFATSLVIFIVSLTTLISVLPVFAASVTVTLATISGPPGTQVGVIGTFTPSNPYTVEFGLTAVAATGIVDARGTIPAFTVPVLPRGVYNVIITAGGDDTASPIPTFTITPQIFISTSSGSVADQINVSGNGFAAGQAIRINFDDQTVASATSDAQGTFSNTTITIPSTVIGNHNIFAKDTSGSSPSVTFSVSPKVTLSATQGTVGATVGISGTGFAPFQTISFFIDNVPVANTATTDGSGKFTGHGFIVPTIAGGDHTIKVQDSLYDSATSGFSVKPSITIQPDHGPVGTTVTITGNGFTPIENNPIVLTYDGVVVTTNPEPVSADPDGNFAATFRIPSGSSGTVTVTAKDNLTTASTDFTSIADIILSATSGHVGTTITASGVGLKANTSININYDATPVGTVTTDSNGGFTTTFQVLPSATGSHEITITSQASTIKYAFQIVPEVKMNPTSGWVGEDVNINGTGFTASSDIIVKYDTDQVAKTTTDASGTFAVAFNAPSSEGGDHQVIVTDGTNVLTSDFAMDSTAPPTPTLLSPSSSTKASKTPTLDWQNVTDPSGVTYTLQISYDNKFDILVLEKQALKTSQYQLTKSESLKSVSKDAPYYWRVKAVDGADNQSAWSAPFTFYVGTVLSTTVYAVIAVVLCAIVGAVAYSVERLRRR